MKSSRKQSCLDDLRHRILVLDIAPGDALDETALSERYGLSRTPLREVLQRLSGDGYVELHENRGAQVASMDLAVMRTFFQTAPLVYCSVARLAAENRTTAQIAGLKAVQGRFAKAVSAQRPGDAALENHRFHALLGEMAANAYLTPSLNRLLIDHTRLSQMFFRPASAPEVAAVRAACDQHDAMIAALEAAAPATMVELTQAHWDLSRDRMERFVRPAPLPLDIAETKNAV